MVQIIGIRLLNIKKFPKLQLHFGEGKSFALVGDTGEGKSTVEQIIKSHLGMIDFPKDALREGQEEAESEVYLQDFATGKKYTSSRGYKKGKLNRFKMVNSEDGSKLVWEDEIKSLFNGVDPKVYYFDYAKYFFECKSADARFDYAMKCVLGELYDKNIKDIDSLEKERGGFGKEEKKLIARLHDSEITADNYDALCLQYEKPKTLDDAREKRDAILEKRPKIQELIKARDHIREMNAKHLKLREDIIFIRTERLPQLERQSLEAISLREMAASFLPSIAVETLLEYDSFLENRFEAGKSHDFSIAMRKELFADISKMIKNVKDISEHENMIRNEMTTVLNTISSLEDDLENTIFQEDIEKDLSEKVDKANEETEKLEKEAQIVYDNFVNEIGNFNQARSKYLLNKTDYDELLTVQKQWKEKDQAMKDIWASTISSFKEYKTFNEIEIREIVTEKKDKENEGEMIKTVKQHLYYKGRELNFENISRGESLQIAILFQTIHEPRLRVVFIPEAQSMGSSFDEIALAAQENGFQWIAEFTERKQPFTMKFTEDIL